MWRHPLKHWKQQSRNDICIKYGLFNLQYFLFKLAFLCVKGWEHYSGSCHWAHVMWLYCVIAYWGHCRWRNCSSTKSPLFDCEGLTPTPDVYLWCLRLLTALHTPDTIWTEACTACVQHSNLTVCLRCSDCYMFSHSALIYITFCSVKPINHSISFCFFPFVIKYHKLKLKENDILCTMLKKKKQFEITILNKYIFFIK